MAGMMHLPPATSSSPSGGAKRSAAVPWTGGKGSGLAPDQGAGASRLRSGDRDVGVFLRDARPNRPRCGAGDVGIKQSREFGWNDFIKWDTPLQIVVLSDKQPNVCRRIIIWKMVLTLSPPRLRPWIRGNPCCSSKDNGEKRVPHVCGAAVSSMCESIQMRATSQRVGSENS